MRRSIDGPDKDLLTREEVCEYLRVSDRQLLRLIRANKFPQGIPYGDRGPYLWQWEDCWSFRHLHGRLARPAAPEKTADGG